MTTVNFSVPEEVKRQFDEAFAGQNKSRLIADLMMRAVDERRAQERRAQAIDRLLSRRGTKQPVAAEQVRQAREAGRP